MKLLSATALVACLATASLTAHAGMIELDESQLERVTAGNTTLLQPADFFPSADEEASADDPDASDPIGLLAGLLDEVLSEIPGAELPEGSGDFDLDDFLDDSFADDFNFGEFDLSDLGDLFAGFDNAD